MKQKINIRLIFISILAVVAVTAGLTLVFYGVFERQVQADLEVITDTFKATDYFSDVEKKPDASALKELGEELRVTWVATDGTVLFDNDMDAAELENHANRPEIRSAFEKGEGESVRNSDTMNMNTYYHAILLDNQTVLRVGTQADSIQAVFFTSLPLVACISAVIIVICIILSHLLTKQLVRPIESMAEKIEENNIEPPYKELVPFADMIRKQHTDIISVAKMRQDFTANVSHELKTPLTAISGYAELIENNMVEEEQEEKCVKEIRKNADRLINVINDIIRLSELDQSETNTGFEEFDAFDVVSETLSTIEVNALKRNITVHFEDEHMKIYGNRDMYQELFDNLIQNAVRYNNEGGDVWVQLINEPSNKRIVIRDNGIGIPDEDKERVFERFYRVDKSRSKETGGTGLGLAIVKHIVELHGAKIELKSEINKGTCITVYI